jgi:hypothetical protein
MQIYLLASSEADGRGCVQPMRLSLYLTFPLVKDFIYFRCSLSEHSATGTIQGRDQLSEAEFLPSLKQQNKKISPNKYKRHQTK